MVINKKKHSENKPAKQGAGANPLEANKIGASTPYDFKGKNLTAYGGLLPVATMLEKLGFQQLVEEVVTITRETRAMPAYQFVLGMVLAIYVGFSRLAHLRFLEREPMLVGILTVVRLPPQSTFWRFLASLHLNVPAQLLEVQRRMRERVWEAAHVQLEAVTLDTDTTVHTLFGNQMGARKGYNPKNRGKKSYQPILTFLHETKEYISGELRTGDRPSGKQIRRHLEKAFATVPKFVKRIYARVDSGFYCWDAVETYETHGAEFILSAVKSPRLVDELKAADWKESPKTDADGQCEFWYQPAGWSRAFRFIALRYEKKAEPENDEPEQYQLFETATYKYRAFVTNMKDPIEVLAWFYDQRAGAENLIKEANNDAGLAAHPSGRWIMNCNHFQLAMLAYNLNCWLLLFNRDEGIKLEQMQHTRLSTARLRFLFVAAKIWSHAGRTGVRYSDHYAEKGLLQRLMNRLRAISASGQRFIPVLATPLVE